MQKIFKTMALLGILAASFAVYTVIKADGQSQEDPKWMKEKEKFGNDIKSLRDEIKETDMLAFLMNDVGLSDLKFSIVEKCKDFLEEQVKTPRDKRLPNWVKATSRAIYLLNAFESRDNSCSSILVNYLALNQDGEKRILFENDREIYPLLDDWSDSLSEKYPAKYVLSKIPGDSSARKILDYLATGEDKNTINIDYYPDKDDRYLKKTLEERGIDAATLNKERVEKIWNENALEILEKTLGKDNWLNYCEKFKKDLKDEKQKERVDKFITACKEIISHRPAK
ncbi:MAG: hypothetical protein HY811_01385 [Planctomycetes bacterium]|nr:hypothetical protein [Planctomycetota bacterium]